jgi:hypothetical protein
LRLFQGVEDKADLGRSRDLPSGDPPDEGINDKGGVDEPLPSHHMVKSETHSAFARDAWNCRFTLSRGQDAADLPTIVFTALPRIAPESPISRHQPSDRARATDPVPA